MDNTKEVLDVNLDRFLSLKAQAEDIGTLLPVLFSFDNGYYWDYMNKCVVEDHSCIIKGKKPELSRADRRAIQRECRMIRKKERARLEHTWGSLRDSLSELVQNLNRSTAQAGNGPSTESGAEDTAPIADVALQEKIQELFSSLGSNGILRFLHWAVEMIAEDISTDPILRQRYLEPNAFTRDREITLSELLLFLLTMSGENMNTEVYEYFKMGDSHPSTAAVVARRSKLKAEGVEYFFKRITEVCQCICRSLSHEFKSTGPEEIFGQILAADGSGISVFLNEADTDTYIRGAEGQKGSNQYHLNALRDHVSGLFLSAVLQPVRLLNETSATVQMVRTMDVAAQSIFMGDRGFGSLNLIHTLNLKENMDFLIRVKESWIKEIRDMPLAPVDRMITIHVITTQRKEDKDRVARGEAKYLLNA